MAVDAQIEGARAYRRIVALEEAREPPLPEVPLGILRRLTAEIGGGAVSPDTARRALEVYRETADPRGLVEPVSGVDFAAVHAGEGLNDPRSPLDTVVPRAVALALFAVTLGRRLSDEITAAFRRGERALAYVLDAVAADRAEAAARSLAAEWLRSLERPGPSGAGHRLLIFSPGYCGWHQSGQRRLFERLQPQPIGIQLNASHAPEPSASLGGVLVVGPVEIETFDNPAFCRVCERRRCLPG
jgi:hypothetical protein